MTAHRAAVPFHFVTASYITQIESQRASTLLELRQLLSSCSDGAVFYHTFQTLGRHHFLTEGFSNDFAQWALAALHLPGLAERLAAIDIRDYVSIEALRADLMERIGSYCDANPEEQSRVAVEPLHFFRAIEVIQPLPWEAYTLAGFRAGLERLGHGSFYFHFIASRLRLKLQASDFSVWFREALQMENLARRADRIDIYTNTIDSARRELIRVIEGESRE